MRVLAVTRCLLLGVVLTGQAPRATAQEMALATRAPRFLFVASSRAAPVEVDGSSNLTLQRVVSLNLEHPTVGRLLAAMERQTGLRFAYSRDVLNPDRLVALRAETITVGAALVSILMDTGVDVVLSAGSQVSMVERPKLVPDSGAVAGRVTERKTGGAIAGATVIVEGTRLSATTGNDGRYRIQGLPAGTYTVRARFIGYAPASAEITVGAEQEGAADFALEKSAQQLNEVVTTGTVAPTEVKALPNPISVITADDIRERGFTRLEEIFRGTIPGALSLDVGPDAGASSVAIRGGTTTSGLNSIKVYIDGVEAASSSSLLRDLDVNSIDRIEIVRGPQASTMYGAEAIDGVMQIFTKRGAGQSTVPSLSVKVSGGTVESPVVGGATAAQQDHALALSGATSDLSYHLGGSFHDVGAWAPAYGDLAATFSAGATFTQGPLTLDLSARYFANRQDQYRDVRLQQRGYPGYDTPTNQYWARREQTYGLTLTYRATTRWRHSLVAGYDATALDYLQDQPQFSTPADSFHLLLIQPANRASIGYHTDLTLPLGRGVTATTTAGADVHVNNTLNMYAFSSPSLVGTIPVDFASRNTWTNSGYFVQGEVGFHDALFLSGGVRADQDPNFGSAYGLAYSPRVGVSYVRNAGSVTVKTRGSYGRGIRPPPQGDKDLSISSLAIQLANPELGPEIQQGYDAGLELYFGGRASLSATYYHQTAIDLIDNVVLAAASGPSPVTQQFQNVGRIKNTGWEFEGTTFAGPLTLSGTLTLLVDNTVQQLSPTYTGDLRVGDRLLLSPRTTAGGRVSYTLHDTELAFATTYIGAHVGIDYLRYFDVLYLGAPSLGPSLRSYWRTYPAFTKFNVMVSQKLGPRLSTYLNIANITNNVAVERTNLDLLIGRTTSVGMRWNP